MWKEYLAGELPGAMPDPDDYLGPDAVRERREQAVAAMDAPRIDDRYRQRVDGALADMHALVLSLDAYLEDAPRSADTVAADIVSGMEAVDGYRAVTEAVYDGALSSTLDAADVARSGLRENMD
ncbi:MAG: hypothetical protein SVU88_02745, partial [Candidatus Nanohaloarchaea archaeon]|nr:hypothetical protein [Candidatus Nanohaloarchaea archaeon]